MSLVKNTLLNGLIGGVENATVGDRMAKKLQRDNKSGFSKVTQHRSGPPIFDVIIELTKENLHEWRIVKNVSKAVDDILAGKYYKAELRRRDPLNTGKMSNIIQVTFFYLELVISVFIIRPRKIDSLFRKILIISRSKLI